MSDQKNHQFRPALYDRAGSQDRTSNGASRSTSAAAPNDSEQQGWEAYRKWLSRVDTQPAQRSSLDASIYSWRGYNSWADKVRQTWKADEPGDS